MVTKQTNKVKKDATPTKDKTLELGAMLQKFYAAGYVSPKNALLFSFLKGVAAGFGAFLGGTILIALLIWLLSLFDSLPFIERVQQLLQSSN